MGRYLGPKCKLCRRADMKLFLKGTRCGGAKCAFSKRPKPPGSSPKVRIKMTNYGLQLREKQKLKRMYGILERQFRRFFEVASRSKGATGRKLIQLLECRLDNVIFRALFALSREQARQIVLHGFVFVGGRRVNIPSYQVHEGSNIQIKAPEHFRAHLKEIVEASLKERSVPGWMKADHNALSLTVVRMPEKEDLVIPISEQLVVELYSK